MCQRHSEEAARTGAFLFQGLPHLTDVLLSLPQQHLFHKLCACAVTWFMHRRERHVSQVSASHCVIPASWLLELANLNTTSYNGHVRRMKYCVPSLRDDICQADVLPVGTYTNEYEISPRVDRESRAWNSTLAKLTRDTIRYMESSKLPVCFPRTREDSARGIGSTFCLTPTER